MYISHNMLLRKNEKTVYNFYVLCNMTSVVEHGMHRVCVCVYIYLNNVSSLKGQLICLKISLANKHSAYSIIVIFISVYN